VEILAVVADRDVWRLNLELLPRNPYGHKWALKEEDKFCGRSNVTNDTE